MRHKVSLGVTVAAAALLVALYVFRNPKRTVPATAPVNQTASEQYPLCVELDRLYARMDAKLSCSVDDSAMRNAICRAAFEEKSACLDELQAATACVNKEPESSWRCGKQGSVELSDEACAPQVAAFRQCLQ